MLSDPPPGQVDDTAIVVATTYLRLFAMPKPVRITGRSSSITNAFVNGVIPAVVPTEDEVREALGILDMLGEVTCAYCGDASTEWDHLRPLVDRQRPTGYISEIRNLVPACGKCNQSKGNKPWRAWMYSEAPRSPKRRGVVDIDDRAERLTRFEQWGTPARIDFAAVVGEDLWQSHWEHHARLLTLMREAEETAREIRGRVREFHDGQG
ncbi:HNH endonuclease [Microbacterium sp. 179-I 3D4 NHS]|uniref:HNH endonuclease n=1 Tax=Microbacterium sp. 179-I 3D4 NHS TaxID=3142381 RepID=UPI0039A123AC